jgi:hypothetical protein
MDCLSQSLIERNQRFPAQLVLYFLTIEGVAAIVARTVSHVGKQGFRFVHHAKKAPCQGQILLHIKTADIVNLADAAAL